MKLHKMMKKGFTLIELLVVIAIIGILASLIIVSLNGARTKASDTQLKNNARNVDTALAQYATDNNSNYPNSITAGEVSTALSTPLTSYLSSANVYAHPKTDAKYVSDAASLSTKYLQVWGLQTKTDTVVTSANGTYQLAASGTIVQNTLTIAGIATGEGTSTPYPYGLAFVTYGPQ